MFGMERAGQMGVGVFEKQWSTYACLFLYQNMTWCQKCCDFGHIKCADTLKLQTTVYLSSEVK